MLQNSEFFLDRHIHRNVHQDKISERRQLQGPERCKVNTARENDDEVAVFITPLLQNKTLLE